MVLLLRNLHSVLNMKINLRFKLAFNRKKCYLICIQCGGLGQYFGKCPTSKLHFATHPFLLLGARQHHRQQYFHKISSPNPSSTCLTVSWPAVSQAIGQEQRYYFKKHKAKKGGNCRYCGHSNSIWKLTRPSTLYFSLPIMVPRASTPIESFLNKATITKTIGQYKSYPPTSKYQTASGVSISVNTTSLNITKANDSSVQINYKSK